MTTATNAEQLAVTQATWRLLSTLPAWVNFELCPLEPETPVTRDEVREVMVAISSYDAARDIALSRLDAIFQHGTPVQRLALAEGLADVAVDLELDVSQPPSQQTRKVKR